ncbi:hypothetical protein [Anaerosacchariphilus polymeriproducens]|uniref:Uncharacterized protein n=1 Tax=Anaerosacchariphilus polymeriproducens TaxID=1812858 RepID=A0A371ARL6_9FIRM|nr:hypothetical protein [Anaerosacchariphilus polymeriproducens]RDU22184.1 hypothetical protein DWV06_16795 [Anaerosacchariphilus polymeriproducens]
MQERRTRKNPGSRGYRVPGHTAGEFRIVGMERGGDVTYFGDMVDELGQYEDLGTIKELQELKERYGKK